jgi:glutamate/tyrosine decarboxylase-like PLP-dependent enzyme
MQDARNTDRQLNPADISPELTKPFRALRMWIPLMLHGLEPFIASLEEKLLLTLYFRNGLASRGFRLGPEPDLSVSYFWYPWQGDEDLFNQQLMEAIHRDGDIFLSSTRLKGKFVIRMAILSFRTHRSTIDRALDMIDRSLAVTRSHW